MKLRLLTFFSIVVALGIKSYTSNAQDGMIDDQEVELLANLQLLNKQDSVNHQKHINLIVTELAASPYGSEEVGGPAGSMTDVYRKYSRLKKAAHSHELNALLQHESPVVRVYAYRALRENEMAPNDKALEAMSMDSTQIAWLDRDIITETTVMDMVSTYLFPTVSIEEIVQQQQDSDSTLASSPLVDTY